MLSRGRLAATALDLPGGVDGLPAISPEDVPLALPRGITGPVFGAEVPPGPQVVAVEMGPIRTEDLDHTGALRFDHVIRHASTLQHTLLNAVGLTQDYADTARINRMGVEFRVTLTGAATPPAGALLRGQTWIPRVSDKRFWAANRITTAEGDLLALVDMCLVTVNLDTRKAVDVPDFMYSSLAG